MSVTYSQTTLAECLRPALEESLGQSARGLVAGSSPIGQLDFYRLIAGAPEMPQAVWKDREGRWIAGFGTAAALRGFGAQRCHQVEAQARAFAANIQRFGETTPLTFLGGLTFATTSGNPSAVASFVLPRWTFTSDGQQVTLHWVLDGSRNAEEWLDEIELITTGRRQTEEGSAPLVTALDEGEPKPALWKRRVQEAIRQAKSGEHQKIVLARRKGIVLARPVAQQDLSRILEAFGGDVFRFALADLEGAGPGSLFLGGSPERLVRLQGTSAQTEALAGTVPVNGANPGFTPKDKHEQALVTEAIREWLSPLATSMGIDSFTTAHNSGNVAHLRTRFEVRLKEARHVLSLVERLHPTPAVAGLPRDRALERIAIAEGFPRRYYAGPVGWFDEEGHGEFSVALRCALLTGETGHIYAGAGIVADSQPAKELEETELKFGAVLGAMGLSSRR